MATFHGREGRIQLGTGLVHITSWTLEMRADIHETTPLDTGVTGQKFKVFEQGHTEWSGSFEGFWDDTTNLAVINLQTTPTTGTLTDGNSRTYTGLMLLSEMTGVNAANDLGRISGRFQGSNTLTIAGS